MPNELELLAPAGSMEALKAAIANGADAVYLGASAFGARASAGFDANALKDAVSLAHLYRKKVYVTVNILIKERELPSVRNTLSLLSEVGADAVLLQDLGLLKICREEFPDLVIHASTQMALHHASGAKLLKDLGAKRAVLARECDLSAIRCAAQTGMEIEAFCHGALCVSCSGQCLFSSMIGGRSGNRGRCAQPCRLPYSYQGKTGAFLSPRDLCARDELDQMGSTDHESDTIFALMHWIAGQDAYSASEILWIQMGCTAHGIDGAYADMYAHILSRALFSAPALFAKALSSDYPAETKRLVLHLTAYDAEWYPTELENATQILEAYLAGHFLSEEESGWVRLLLLYLSTPIDDRPALPKSP